MFKLVKQPAETYLVGVDFSALLQDGEAVDASSSSFKAYDNSGTDISDTFLSGSLSLDGTTLQGRLAAGQGTAGQIYTISFRAGTSLSNVYEEDIYVVCKD